MIAPEIKRLYDILTAFLGPSKGELDESYQLQFSCPHCQERDGSEESQKYHLEVNLQKGLYNCWKCSSIDDSMKGSVYSLIRKYGTPQLLKSYKDTVRELRESSLYKIHFSKDDFSVDFTDAEDEFIELPKHYCKFQKDKHGNTQAFQYLSQRGIGWPIIEKYSIGFTSYHDDDKNISKRIILPSFDKYGDVNYWTGRDYTGNPKRQRYFNPKVERKDIIFNEDKVQWNADITLVEGPFDHIVVPNSIPLLGKSLNPNYYLYERLVYDAKANVNIFLDADAIDTVRKLYKTLDSTKLHGRVRYVPVKNNLDPSEIFKLYGFRGVVSYLRNATVFNEFDLINL